MSTKFRAGTLAIAVSLALGTAPSYAEENTGAEQEVERIAVIGSRAAPRSVAESPVPIDIIGGDELGRSASSDMLELLATAVPSFTARQQPISDAATLIRPINLRGLPSDSTLILLNGKRRHRASVIAFSGGGINDGAQGADVSVIPSVALKQVEVLRDGAAAQYGSDAIAGVMNFVLKDDSDGGSLSVKTGEYYEGDGATTVIDGNIGLPFTKDGFANLSFQLKNSDPTIRSVQRPDAANLQAQGNSGVPDPAMIWGSPKIEDDITFFANIGLDLGDDKEFYLFGNFSERTADGGFYFRNPHNRGNVFSTDGGATLLVGDVAQAAGAERTCGVVNVPKNADGSDGNVLETAEYQAMVADPNCFSMNQLKPGGFTPRFGGTITDTALTMGTKGEIKSGVLEDWYFDLSGSVGRNASAFYLNNTLNPSMGLESPTNFDTGKYIQLEKTFNFDLVRSFDVGIEDDLNFATGLEWRQESFEILIGEEASWKRGVYADQGFVFGSNGFTGFAPDAAGLYSGHNIAAYVDVEGQVTEKLLLGGALRYEDFSAFGDTTNYKLTAQFELNDELSFRASHSTGFRAPTTGQANVVNTQTANINKELTQISTAPPTDPLSIYYGAKALTPEKSTSYAAGLVFQKDNLFMTVDYYNIEVDDRLAIVSGITIQEEDYEDLRGIGVQNPELFGQVSYFANAFTTTTEGFDVVGNYSMELFGGDTKLSLAYNYNKTNVDKHDSASVSDGKVRRLEEEMPNHSGNFTLSQTWEDVSMFVRANYYGEYWAVHAADTSDGGDNDVADSAMTVDAEINYFFSDSFTFSAGANNIFDQEAEKVRATWSGAQYYENGPFDYSGGYYYVKATYNF